MTRRILTSLAVGVLVAFSPLAPTIPDPPDASTLYVITEP